MLKSQTIQDIKPSDDTANKDSGTPIIVKHESANTQAVNNSQPDNSKDANMDKINIVSNTAATVMPPSEQPAKDVTIDTEKAKPESIQPAKEEPEEKTAKDDESEKPVTNESYVAVDGLPSKNEQDTTTATNNMQQPRIYDTKEYFVPINDITHKHGYPVGTIIAGILSALVVLAVIYFVAIGL